MHLNVLFVMALLCQWVYDPTGRPLPSGVVAVHHTADRFAVVSVEELGCVVVHRGTDSMRDILRDIQAEVDAGVHCHQHYLRAFKESLSEFRAEQDAVMEDLLVRGVCSSFMVTGHSLGGATATITHGTDERVTNSFTFGAPRTCCGDNTALSGHLRVVNGDVSTAKHDPVPAFPRGKMHHCGWALATVGDRGLEQEIGAQTMVLPAEGTPALLGMHHIDVYVKRLEL